MIVWLIATININIWRLTQSMGIPPFCLNTTSKTHIALVELQALLTPKKKHTTTELQDQRAGHISLAYRICIIHLYSYIYIVIYVFIPSMI